MKDRQSIDETVFNKMTKNLSFSVFLKLYLSDVTEQLTSILRDALHAQKVLCF